MNVGIDIIDLERLTEYIDISKKILSKDEHSIMQKYKTIARKKEFVAGRWAAKEAIYKCTNKNIPYSLMNIVKDKNKMPIYINNKNIKISISHEKKYCVAVAILI